MEELGNVISCVAGDARQRRAIHEVEQDFEPFGKTFFANFKETAILRECLRTSLRQCHIHTLSKVGKDRAAWAKADEYPTDLVHSDIMLTLINTDDAIKRAENYLQRQDIEGDKRTAFSSAFDEDTEHEFKALRAAFKEKKKRLEEKDQRLSALETKFDSFSHDPREGNKRKKTTRKECDYCKKNWQVLSRPRNLHAYTIRETKQTQSSKPSRRGVQESAARRP